MFGFGAVGKHKRILKVAFAACLQPLKDELGNVPIPMQTDPSINAAILGVCKAYSVANNVTKTTDIAVIADAVFEELYRRESIKVQDRVDEWKNANDDAFMQSYHNAKSQTTADLDLSWLTEYATRNFEPATGKML